MQDFKAFADKNHELIQSVKGILLNAHRDGGVDLKCRSVKKGVRKLVFDDVIDDETVNSTFMFVVSGLNDTSFECNTLKRFCVKYVSSL
jgi:hypothetical protein